jgi:transposase
LLSSRLLIPTRVSGDHLIVGFLMLLFTDPLPAELRALTTRSDDTAQTRRPLAIAMVVEETSRPDAARQTRMDRQTLPDWVHRLQLSRFDGLASRKPPGASPKLSEAQMRELDGLVMARPDPKIHKVVRWRCVDLRAEVAKRFSVTVSERTIAKWLRKLKLTRLQPRPYHPKKGRPRLAPVAG